MIEGLGTSLQEVFNLEYWTTLIDHPLRFIMSIIDIILVVFLIVFLIRVMKDTRAWQLVKGIAVVVICTILSGLLNLTIVNIILTSVIMYGGFALIVIFQPELRRGLEQIGSSGFSKVFSFTKDDTNKTKEMIYQVTIATTELAKNKTGALIAIERDIKIKDIIDTGIKVDAEVSPQLLVNLFVPNTPLHDGAVVISDNKVAAASCMLPLSNDDRIPQNLGTRHRAAVGLSSQSDAIVIVVSEETGKISIAKDGTLVQDVKEDVLRKILLKNLVTEKEEVKKTDVKTQDIEKKDVLDINKTKDN